jgi:toxin ParE1/3/4
LAAEASEDVASQFVAEIQAAFEPVRYFPLAAPAREQLAPQLRVTFHGAYAIYYRPSGDAIVIIRVLHGARDVAAIADGGRFRG